MELLRVACNTVGKGFTEQHGVSMVGEALLEGGALAAEADGDGDVDA